MCYTICSGKTAESRYILSHKHFWTEIDAHQVYGGFWYKQYQVEAYIGCGFCYKWRDNKNVEDLCNGAPSLLPFDV